MSAPHPDDPAVPLRHRTDLPEHERGISAESVRMLNAGIAEAKAGKLTAVPPEAVEDCEDDE